MLSQSSIPEVKEEEIGYALNERRTKLLQFQDLGPPDLITLIKYLGSTASTAPTLPDKNADSSGVANIDPATILTELHSHDKLKGEIGTYFYTLGADTSDPTSITVFLKKIADLITEQPQVWFGKRRGFQVARVSMSTWNTFRKCDINIIVHMPGTVQMFVLNSNGDQLQIEPDSEESRIIWAETFMSGVVRSMMLMKDNYEDGEVQNLVETLIIDPLTSGELDAVADTFIDLFPTVYENGDLLGAPCNVINVSRTNNYLAETLIEIVKLTHSLDQCRAMLTKLMETFPEAVILLARVLLTNDLEIDAIELIYEQLQKIEGYESGDTTSNGTSNISSANLPFLPGYKSELLCLQVEFLLYSKNDYSLAQSVAQDAVNCTPSEFKPWYLLTSSYIKLNDIETACLSLNACPMSSTNEKYVLKRVVQFPTNSSLHLPLPVDAVLDDVTSLNPQDIQREHKEADQTLVNLAAANLKSTFQLGYKLLTDIVQVTGWETLLKLRSRIFVMEDEYQNFSEEVTYSSTNANTAASLNNVPVDDTEGVASEIASAADQTMTTNASNSNPVHNNITSNMGSTNTISSNTTSSLRAKRLCERWLDNLFMLLYEDLKTYSLWQSEQLYFEAEKSEYKKLTFEWELFGMCARRLGHYPEAAKAFQKGLSQRFSSQSARKLLEFCINERQRIRQLSNVPNSTMTSGQIMARVNELDMTIIDLCVKICCWNHRWYIEFSTQLLSSMAIVVQDLGLTKVSNEILARYPESVYNLVKDNILIFLDNFTNDFFDS